MRLDYFKGKSDENTSAAARSVEYTNYNAGKEPKVEEKPKEAPQEFKCNTCDFKTTSEKEIQEHVKTHNVANLVEEKKPKKGRPKKAKT